MTVTHIVPPLAIFLLPTHHVELSYYKEPHFFMAHSYLHSPASSHLFGL